MAITQVGNILATSSLNGVDITLTFSTVPQAGDVVYLWGGHTSTRPTPIGPSTAGYVNIGGIQTATTNTFGVWRKVLTAADTTVVGLGTGNNADSTGYGCIVLRGVDTTYPEDAVIVFANGSSTNPDPGSITPLTSGGAVIICAGTVVSDSAWTNPANYSATVASGSADTNPYSIGGSVRLSGLTGGTPENPAAFTNVLTGVWIAATIAVRLGPAAPLFRQSDWPLPKPPAFPFPWDNSWLQPGQSLLTRVQLPALPAGISAFPISGTTISGSFLIPPASQEWLDWTPPATRPVRDYSWFNRGILTAVAVVTLPCNQRDWPLPQLRLSADQSWIFPTSIGLRSLRPFRQTEWPAFQRPPSADTSWFDSGQGLLVSRPFRQQDWPLPVTRQVVDYSWTQSGLALQTPVQVQQPFNQDDWPLPAVRIGGDLSWVVPASIALLTTAAQKPFNQEDWPPPPRPPQPDSWVISTSIELRTSRQFPFNQFDWPLPGLVPRAAEWLPPYNIALLTTPAQKPFNQEDWPPVPRPPQPDSWVASTSIELRTQQVQVPFNQDDWPLPARPPQPDTGFAQTSIALHTARPFSQTDWSVPVQPTRPDTWVAQTNIALLSARPISQPDWSTPVRIVPPQSWIEQTNLALLAAPQAPFRQQDWPLPRLLSQIDTSSTPRNTALLSTPPAARPFGQTDWPLPQLRRPPADPGILVQNLPLQGTPPRTVPFNQFDWPLPVRRPQNDTWFASLTPPTAGPVVTEVPRIHPFFATMGQLRGM